MSLTRVLNNVVSAFCLHEWARRREGGHVYLECMHCLATTPGIDLTPAGRRSVDSLQTTPQPSERRPTAFTLAARASRQASRLAAHGLRAA